MSKYLPPKRRNTPLMSFYSLGETQPIPKPTRFTAHSAEPGPAATLAERNPHSTETMNVKPTNGRVQESAAHVAGLYSNRSLGHVGESTLNQGFLTLEALKIAKARAYSQCYGFRLSQTQRVNVTQADFLMRKMKAPELGTGTVVQPNDFHVTNRLETVRQYDEM